jgi:hypothetical protein
MAGRVRHHGEVQPGEEGNNLMWLLDFKLDFFNDAEAKEKGKQRNFSIFSIFLPSKESRKSIPKVYICRESLIWDLDKINLVKVVWFKPIFATTTGV